MRGYTACVAITVAQFRTHLEAARAALGSADYTTAELELLQAQACLMGLPDGAIAGVETQWRSLTELQATVARLKANAAAVAAGGLGSIKIEYTEVSD